MATVLMRCGRPLGTGYRAVSALHRCHGQRSFSVTARSPSDTSNLSIIQNAYKFGERTAVVDVHGAFTYTDLIHRTHNLGKELLQTKSMQMGLTTLKEENVDVGPRVAILCPNDSSYVVSQWAVWSQGCVAVPLCPSHPHDLLEYLVQDSGSSLLITTEKLLDTASEIVRRTGVELFVIPRADHFKTADIDLVLSELDIEKDPPKQNSAAHILYTSGVTGKPKGIIATHGNLRAQIESLVSAWEWSSKDSLVHVMPLHHLHGIVNCLLCPLWVGATCIMLPKFDARQVWTMFEKHIPESYEESGVTIPEFCWPNLFMAVPTIYSKLIQEYYQSHRHKANKLELKERLKQFRLMVSGSASLPVPVMSTWEELTGHRLLERYGLTEAGMVLSNPYRGQRKPGSVGNPLPGVQVRLVNDDGMVIVEGDQYKNEVLIASPETPGELQVKGPGVFAGYWRRPEATKQAFTDDGWLKSEDIAVFKDGQYKILGRTSVDIISTGGYKVSALDIERLLLGHGSITDCAVFGIKDDVLGESIVATVTISGNEELKLEEVRDWLAKYLPSYCLPTALKIVSNIPRDIVGNVDKSDLKKSFLRGK